MPRPELTPTAAQLHFVSTAAGAGMRHSEIAAALGISRPTLVKHFGDALFRGAALRRMEVLPALYRAAMRGNVTAMKQYLRDAPEVLRG